jgi:hypothetical protein
MRFGLYDVHPDTKARAMRDSGAAFARMAKSRDIPADLESAYASQF